MWSRGTLVAGLLLLSPIAFAAELPPVEPMPTLAAATLAPAALLDGAGYTVDADVPVVGYMGQFTLRAPAAPSRRTARRCSAFASASWPRSRSSAR